MGQVPPLTLKRYGILGAGKVATHFKHYFSLLGLPTQSWTRDQDQKKQGFPKLKRLVDESNVILVLVKDSAISEVVKFCFTEKPVIHFSGSLTLPDVMGMHPLMTFGAKLYNLHTYERIPFICEKTLNPSHDFKAVFPNLKNPHFTIAPEFKPLYHALCVLSGNFTNLLWSKFFTSLESKFGLPRSVALPYLEQTFRNLMENPQASLTGPLARKDELTLKANLRALKNDPYFKVYQSIKKAYEEENP